MNEGKGRKSGCGCFLGIIIIILIGLIITIFIAYNTNPEKLQETLLNINEKLQQYIIEKNEINNNQTEILEFPDEEKLTEAQKYYYYQQLSDTAKKIYITIENNIEEIKNGKENIPLPSSLNEIAKSNKNGKELIATEFQNAWDAFITDKSEFFYLDSSKVCLVTKSTTKGSNVNYEFYIGKGNNKNYFINNFNNIEEVQKAVNELEYVKNNILKNATGSNYEKILYIHNWIIENVEYDTLNKNNNSNIYGCLVNKSAICEGYARTYKYLMDELNIPCIIVSGSATDENGYSERHAWNYVYINNNWYAVDTTWDDPIIIGNGVVTNSIKYRYFLKGYETMSKDHVVNGQISKNGFEFKYPELCKNDIK